MTPLVASRMVGRGARVTSVGDPPAQPPPQDTVAPTLLISSVNGTSAMLDYDEALNEAAAVATGSFTINTTGAAQTVASVVISGQAVILTLSPGVANGDTVSVDYTAGDPAIEDLAFNNAANLTTQSLTNNTPAPGAFRSNEPVNFTSLTEIGFNSTAENGWGLNPTSNVTIVSDTGAPESPNNVMQFKYPENFSASGIAPGTYFKNLGGGNEVYLSLQIKISDPWQNHETGVNKIFFLFGPGSQDVFVALRPVDPLAENYRIQFITQGQTDPRTNWFSNDESPNTFFSLGTYHEIELYVKLGSNDDGIIRMWQDGVLLAQVTDFNFAMAEFGEMKISPTWGGLGTTVKAQDDFYWLDHLYVSEPV